MDEGLDGQREGGGQDGPSSSVAVERLRKYRKSTV